MKREMSSFTWSKGGSCWPPALARSYSARISSSDGGGTFCCSSSETDFT